MNSKQIVIAVVALGLFLLTISAAAAGDANTTVETDTTQTWSQTFQSTDLTGLDVRTLDTVSVLADAIDVSVADKAKNVTATTDTWDVNVGVGNLVERCDADALTADVPDCVDTTNGALTLGNAYGTLAPDGLLSTSDVTGVGSVTNPSNLSTGPGGTMDAAKRLFGGTGYNSTGNAIGLYRETGVFGYDWDTAMSAAGVSNPGDYVGAIFDSTVTVTLVE